MSRSPYARTATALALVPVSHLLVSGWTGGPDPGFLSRYVLYAGLAAAPLARVVRRDPDRNLLDAPAALAVTILVLWIPLDFRWLEGFPLPAGAADGLDVRTLIAAYVGLTLAVGLGRVPDLGYTFRFQAKDLFRATVALLVYAAFAVPFGLAVGFLTPGRIPFEPVEWSFLLLNIYFLVAVPEELLFRGLLQNLVEQRWKGPRSPSVALCFTAVVFGAAHLNNPPAPNLQYAVLASFAGLAYGWVWLKTRKVTAAALTHAAVDWIWVVMLRG